MPWLTAKKCLARYRALLMLTGGLVLALGLSGCSARQKPASPLVTGTELVSLNQMHLPVSESGSFKFVVAGHIYGSQDEKDTMPDYALVDQLPAFNQMGLSMFISLGDIVEHAVTKDFNHLDENLLSKLDIPVLNTVGNHDVGNRTLYERLYGQTYYAFQYSSAEFIFLDTERVECTIDDPQREMMNRALEDALNNDQVKNVFIFMHKTLFFQNARLFELQVRSAGPNVWDCYGHDFWQLMDEKLIPAAAQKPVYLFAGDVGAWENLSPYYEKRTDVPLTMVMTGIGDSPKDAVIMVAVENEDVTLQAYRLADGSSIPLEQFSPDYWISVAEGVEPAAP